MACDPNVLWGAHNIRWLDEGKKGPGWYKLKQTGRATFWVKLTAKECPICYRRLNDIPDGFTGVELEFYQLRSRHPRPDEWLKEAPSDRKAAVAEVLLAKLGEDDG